VLVPGDTSYYQGTVLVFTPGTSSSLVELEPGTGTGIFISFGRRTRVPVP